MRDYNDFRDLSARPDVDAVFIASPENWHGLHALAAARAKKDIYGEKAFTRTIAEGQAVVKAVRENKCVFQIGHQQRHDPIFRLAVEMVQQGEIGDLRRIKVGVPPNRTGPTLSPQPLPEGFDYDLWLGPVARQTISARTPAEHGVASHLRLRDRLHGGLGCAHLDIAQWANQADQSGPVEAQCAGVFPTEGIPIAP